MITWGTDYFPKKRNRTLDRHRIFSRLQQPGKTLAQFWHALNGHAAICDFGEVTTTLVLDMFILHMSKKTCRGTVHSAQRARSGVGIGIAFEEGVKRQKSYGLQAPEAVKPSLKSEPVYAVEKTKSRECFRCGESNITMEHVNFCIARNHRCNYLKVTGHLEIWCNVMFPQRQKKMMQWPKNG